MHTDDETYAEVFHVHEATASRDCDGPFERYSTYRIPMLRWLPGELDFKRPATPDADDLWVKLCRLSIPLHTTVEIKVTENDDGTMTMTWGHATDEGFRSQTLTGCKDPDCAHDDDSQRDHYAEAMGY